ncbi:MAG TPA: DUF3575 domain-containing protein, partial [Chitinophagales bacterium]|nr:DUF3575 domain-containing protein [Chitinophagales bacterium]
MRCRPGYLLFLLVMLGVVLPAYAQKTETDTSATRRFKGFRTPRFPSADNVIKSNLIPILFGQIPLCGEIRVTYERMIWHNQSISLGASYNFPNLFAFVMPAIINPNRTTLKRYSLRGARITFGYRYYPLSSEAPKGFFFGPYFSYNFVRIQERHGNGSYELVNYINGSLICGYQAKFGKHIFFEVFGGLGYKRNFSVFYDSRSKDKFTEDL